MKSQAEILPQWVSFFEDLQFVRGRSLNTIQAYRRDLELFCEYRQKESTILGFYEFMKSKKLSVRSQARVISSLRTYYKFCENRGFQSPELRDLRPPKVKVGLPKPLSNEEVQSLLKACVVEDLNKTARNQITLLMLFGLGCRVSELCGLSLHDYNETDRWLKVLGKGNKERLIPLTDTLQTALQTYLEKVRPMLLKDSHEDSILINDRGHRPTRVDIWRWLSAWSKAAGFESPVGPHRLRHSCATALLESGADLRSIQILLGHSSIQTTQIYTNVTTQNLVNTVDAHHPLSEIKDL